MTQITLKGNPIHTVGTLPKVGQKTPNAQFTLKDLSDVDLDNYKGKKIILNIFPSLDTATCAMSVRKFNQEASKLSDAIVVLCISADLPFAQSRFCGAEGIDNVITGSVFRHPEFGEKFGVTMTDGPLAGLLSRAIVVLNEKHEVIYTEQAPEIVEEHDYEKALSAVNLSFP